MIKKLDYNFDIGWKTSNNHKIQRKRKKNTTVAVKEIGTKILIQNYYVKQNILTKMIELILNQRMTKFQLIVNEQV